MTQTQERSDGAIRLGPEARNHPPRRLPTWLRIGLAIAAMFLSIYSMMILAVFPLFRGSNLDEESDLAAAIALTVAYGVVTIASLLMVWLLMRFIDRRPWRETGIVFHSRALGHFLGGVAVAAAIFVPIAAALSAMGMLRPTPADAIWVGEATWLVIVVGLGMAFLLQGIPEEVIWRGYVLQTLRTSPVTSMYISAAVFAVLHLVSSGGQQTWWEYLTYLLAPFGFSVLAGALVIRTGSWWWAPGVHGGFHVGSLISHAFLDLGEGPALWAAVGLAMTGVGALIARGAQR